MFFAEVLSQPSGPYKNSFRFVVDIGSERRHIHARSKLDRAGAVTSMLIAPTFPKLIVGEISMRNPKDSSKLGHSVRPLSPNLLKIGDT